MMYDITNFPLTHRWLARDWTSRAGDLGIHIEHKDFGGKDPSRLLSQYVIWGLNHLMLSIYLSKHYCQTIAVLKWRGTTVGVLFVARTASLGLTPDFISRNATDALRDARRKAPTITDEALEVTVRYRTSPPIDRQIIYLTGIKAMGEAAEIGLDQIVQEVFTQGLRQVYWKLSGGTPAVTGMMKPKYSRIAVIKTIAAMVGDGKFQDIDVWVNVGGQNIGVGGFYKG